jgi:hypothetical protein
MVSDWLTEEAIIRLVPAKTAKALVTVLPNIAA